MIAKDKEELKNRLIKRNQNTQKEIDERLNSFEADMKHWNDYDYIVINNNLDACFRQIENIISIEKKEF